MVPDPSVISLPIPFTGAETLGPVGYMTLGSAKYRESGTADVQLPGRPA